MEILAAVTAETTKSCINFIFSRIKTIVKFQRNVKSLQDELQKLTVQRNSIQENIEFAQREGKSPTSEVSKWLRDVEGLERDVCSMFEDGKADSTKQKCYCNVFFHYWQSKRVSKMLKKVQELIGSCNFQVMLADKTTPSRVVQRLPAESLADQEAALETLKRLMDSLNDDSINRIALWGMGGVGKTTLLRNLINIYECSLTESFDIVIWVTVSKDVDLPRIQSVIAKRLNLELHPQENMLRWAHRIYRRLMAKRKSLLILSPPRHYHCHHKKMDRYKNLPHVSYLTVLPLNLRIIVNSELVRLFSRSGEDVQLTYVQWLLHREGGQFLSLLITVAVCSIVPTLQISESFDLQSFNKSALAT